MSEAVARRISDALVYRKQALDSAKVRLSNAQREVGILYTAQEVDEQATHLAKLCVSERGKVKDDIEDLATSLLRALFGEHYSFEFCSVEDTDGTLIGLRPTIFEYEYGDDASEFGGGVSNTLSLGCRIVTILLKPELTPVLLLDEPNVNLDTDKWDDFVRFMESLCEDVELQIIAVTHSESLFPQTVRVSKPSRESVVEVL